MIVAFCGCDAAYSFGFALFGVYVFVVCLLVG